MVYDVLIIGAGPAGATLARLMAATHTVLIVDRLSCSDAAHGKCCGGLLSTDAQETLAAQGLTLPASVLCDPQIFAVDTWDLSSGDHQRYPRHYLNLHRYAFDRWLRSLIPCNVTQLEGRVTHIARCEDGFCITVGPHTYRGRLLIGADGAGSLVRRTCFKDHHIPRYMAIQQVFPAKGTAPAYRCLFHHPSTPVCGWSITKDGQLTLGGAFPIRHSRQHYARFRAAFEQRMGLTLPMPLRTEACVVYRPRQLRHLCLGTQDVFLVGEAAGFISPSSMEGISFALRSAEALAQALQTADPKAAYRKTTRSLALKLLGKSLKCPFMYVPWLRRRVMRSRLTAL